MRVSFLVYGVLYVVIEMIGHSLASVGLHRITALDAGTAVNDAFLTVSVALAVLLALKLGAERCRRLGAEKRIAGEPSVVLPAAPLGVRSWRADPHALPAAVPAQGPVRGTYEVGAYGPGPRRRTCRLAPSFPEEPGALL